MKVPHKGDYRYITNERMLGSYIKDETQKDKARLPKDELTCLIGGREDPEKKDLSKTVKLDFQSASKKS